MAVSHVEISVSHRNPGHSEKIGLLVIVLSILFGFFSFILCLLAETSRSEATWVLMSNSKEKGKKNGCIYSSSGWYPLSYAVGAFGSLGIAMVLEHAYVLIAVSQPSPSPETIVSRLSSTLSSANYRSLVIQASLFFVFSWICFTVSEVLLLIGIVVESGHMTQWGKPRSSCLLVGQGLFSAAGVFGLATVFLAGGLYLTTLRVDGMRRDESYGRQEAMNFTLVHAPPVMTPRDWTVRSQRLRQGVEDGTAGPTNNISWGVRLWEEP